jgi:hypothetical protein
MALFLRHLEKFKNQLKRLILYKKNKNKKNNEEKIILNTCSHNLIQIR